MTNRRLCFSKAASPETRGKRYTKKGADRSRRQMRLLGKKDEHQRQYRGHAEPSENNLGPPTTVWIVCHGSVSIKNTPRHWPGLSIKRLACAFVQHQEGRRAPDRVFMAVVERRKLVVFGLVLLAALITTVAVYQTFGAYAGSTVRTSDCWKVNKMVQGGWDRYGESALKEFVRGFLQDSEFVSHAGATGLLGALVRVLSPSLA